MPNPSELARQEAEQEDPDVVVSISGFGCALITVAFVLGILIGILL